VEENTMTDKLYIDANKIITKNNPRIDFGNIEGLAKSIIENGQLEPVGITGKTLKYGERRVRAIKWANENGHPDLKVWCIDVAKDADDAIIKLVENDQRKDLTVLEQGNAYRQYISKNNCTLKDLAEKLGKSKEYITRRINLLTLSEKCKTALNENKIELGHAVILATLSEREQNLALEEVIKSDLTVTEFKEILRWTPELKKMDLSDLPFRLTEEEKKQKTLFDSIGEEFKINDEISDPASEILTNPIFKKKMVAYVESVRKEARDKGITVFDSEEDLKKEFPKAIKISSWDNPGGIKNKIDKSKTHVMVIDLDMDLYNPEIEKTIFRKEPPKPKKSTEQAFEKAPYQNEAEKEEYDAKQKETAAKDKLKSRVKDFKYQWIKESTAQNLQNQDFDILNLYVLLSHTETWPKEVWGDIEEKYKIKWNGCKYNVSIEDLYKLEHEDLIKYIELMMRAYVRNGQVDANDENLILLANNTGVKLEDFTITEDFLKLHTKDQLEKLAVEIGAGTGVIFNKKDETISAILEKNKEKRLKVPKILGKTLKL
jgi:ParB family chromosome partitioning protein